MVKYKGVAIKHINIGGITFTLKFVHSAKSLQFTKKGMVINMERRRYKRLPIDIRLEVDEIFKQGNIVIKNVDASAYVFDISRNGIGFICETELPVGYYFRAYINLGEGDFFYVVIRIIRATTSEFHRYIYGAEFVGLASFLADKVDMYERKLELRSEMNKLS